MSDMARYTFDEWQEAFPFKESEPMREESLTPNTCFIRVSTTSPLPAAAHWETWEWTDDATALLGYTANVVLPDLIATWFFEQSDGERVPSREYLSLARKNGSLVRDIPVVEDVLGALETIDPTGRADEILAGLARVSSAWNARFARTGTWDLSFGIFPDLKTAASAFWDRYYENYPPEMNGTTLAKNDWMELCQGVVDNPDAQSFLIESFSQDFF